MKKRNNKKKNPGPKIQTGYPGKQPEHPKASPPPHSSPCSWAHPELQQDPQHQTAQEEHGLRCAEQRSASPAEHGVLGNSKAHFGPSSFKTFQNAITGGLQDVINSSHPSRLASRFPKGIKCSIRKNWSNDSQTTLSNMQAGVTRCKFFLIHRRRFILCTVYCSLPVFERSDFFTPSRFYLRIFQREQRWCTFRATQQDVL